MYFADSHEDARIGKRLPHEPVVRALPRRERYPNVPLRTPRIRELTLPTVSSLQVVARVVKWAGAIVGLGAALAMDQARGRSTVRLQGKRARAFFERMGATGVKIGQQLGIRVDMLPYEVCEELAGLLDDVPPFPFDVAKGAIERAAGRPLDEVFATLHPAPIGSASISCVWRGTLIDGREVAVKVRRPGVAVDFIADLRALSLLTRFFELTTLVRPDFFRHLRNDAWDMFLEELDFVQEAHYGSVFRRFARRDGLPDVDTARVIGELSNHEVLTTEFIHGTSLLEILRAVETHDAPALEELRRQDIDPGAIGRKLVQMAGWGRFESPLYHADPHPGNIIVQPGTRLVLLDFGACGVTSDKNRAHGIELNRRLISGDVPGAAAVLMSVLAPLPYIDVEELQRRIERRLWLYYVNANSKHSHWWEHTSAVMFMHMMEATKDFNLPVNLEVLRSTRATLLYDTLGSRLDADFRPTRELKKYARNAAKRANRRRRREWRKTDADALGAGLTAITGEFTETLQKSQFWLAHTANNLPLQFYSQSSKAAYFAGALLKFALVATSFLLVATLAGMLFSGLFAAGGTTSVLGFVTAHPLALALLAVLFVANLRRALRRLDQADPVR